MCVCRKSIGLKERVEKGKRGLGSVKTEVGRESVDSRFLMRFD